MSSSTGLHILHDSGAPTQSVGDYTTLVFVHGYGYHSGTFLKMVPYAGRHNTRLVLVNRRDYPGAEPYSEEARSLLSPGTEDLNARRTSISLFMKERALEFMAFLAELVQQKTIPAAQSRRTTSGIILVGWSMGTLWMTSFLAHVPSSPHARMLREYIRRIIFYDTPSTTFGYPRPDNVFDPFMLAMQGDRRFLTSDWFSGYFAHGSTVQTLEYKTPLPHPPPTLSTFSPAEKELALAAAPVSRGGSDQILAFDGYRCGLFREVWQHALYLAPRSPPGSRTGAEEWEDVEVHHVWCDMSFWETAHAAAMLQAELADARARGRRVRDVAGVRLRGVNHFGLRLAGAMWMWQAHWTHPERVLRAFLAPEEACDMESPARARL